MQNLSETMALASSHGEAEASLPSFARTLMIKKIVKTILVGIVPTKI
ncbi:MAG: hypothetical protein U9O24_00360 [Campylobacterota bacterium]|nr:hypothetical protein [Campylobacterota bacterium]